MRTAHGSEGIVALEDIGVRLVTAGENLFFSTMIKAQQHINDVAAATDKAAVPTQNLTTKSLALGVALGQALYQGAMAAGRAMVGLVESGLEAYKSYEMMSMSLTSLTARELMNASAVEKTTYSKRQATGAEIARRKELTEELAIQEKAVKKTDYMSDAYLKAAKAANTTRMEIQALGIDQNGYVTSTSKSTTETMNMAQALAEAAPKARELLDWVQLLAINSPFTSKGVADAFKTVMAYGFTTDEAKRMTTAMIDYAAATGQSEATMSRIALALGQIRARGKLAGGEVMQLTEAGVPVTQILAKAFNVTTKELMDMQEKGLIPADRAIEAITKSIEKDFGGAAKRTAGTFSGLISSLEDIKEVGLREFFTGTFKAIQPYFAQFVDFITQPKTLAMIKNWGESLGKTVTKFIDFGRGVADTVKKLTSGANVGGIIQSIFGVNAAMQFDTIIGKFSGTFERIKGIVNSFMTTVQAWWVEHGAQIIADVNDLWDGVKGLFDAAMKFIGTLVDFVLTNIEAFWKAHGKDVMNIVEGLWNTIRDVFKTVTKTVTGIFQAFTLLLKGDWRGFGATLLLTWNNLWADIMNAAAVIWQQLSFWFNSIIASIKVWFNTTDWWSLGTNLLTDIWNGVKAIWISVTDWFTKTAIPAVFKWFGDTDWVQIGTDLLNGIWKGIEAGWGWLLGKVSELVASLIAAAKESLKNAGAGGGTGGASLHTHPGYWSYSEDPVTGKSHRTWVPEVKHYHQGGGSWIVPPGYNENYPVGPGHYASSGEMISVIPKGMTDSIQAALSPIMGMSGGASSYNYSTANNYNLNVMSSQSPQVVQRSFAMMKLLAG